MSNFQKARLTNLSLFWAFGSERAYTKSGSIGVDCDGNKRENWATEKATLRRANRHPAQSATICNFRR